MKILLVNDVPTTGGHGTENHICMLADAFREQGHEPFILAGQHRGEPLHASAGCRFIPDLNAPLIRKRQFKHLRGIRSAHDEMRRFVAGIEPDVIHVHNMLNPYTLEALRALGPVVKSIHDCRPFCSKPPATNVASRLVGNSHRFCERTFGPGCWPRCYLHWSPKDMVESTGFFIHNLMAFRQVMRCERVVVYSGYLRDLAIQAGCDAGKIDLIHLFLDRPPIGARQQHFPKAKKIMFAGFLNYEKGVMHLLETVRRIPDDFETLIIGDGPLMGEARARAAAMPGKRITFAGYLSHEQVVGHYREATVVVFPSIGSEGCGLVGLEALANGKPVVGFDVGGVSEWLIDGVTGYLAPRGDVAQLAEKIGRLLADEAAAQRMGQAGINLVAAKFRKDLHLGRILGVYAEAIRQSLNR